MGRKEIIALILAGGQGSRLGVLSKTIAKPAILFGGKYRIIDFSLSNCINSGIDTVGVLTQYQPLKLNSHIGIGSTWDMDRINGGVTILSPYLKSEEGEWYKGTANAVYQNIHYIDSISPNYIAILSGDHVYKMNYSDMLDFHKSNNADATISVINVPIGEASRYGIMNTNENGKIYEFEEKPSNPKSTLASMGVYIFKWSLLREYLIADNKNQESNHDFGKNLIPKMLKDGCNMWACNFDGYWRDVGTIHSYWESNMDLIARIPEFNLYDPAWRIYTPNLLYPPHYLGHSGSVKKSIVSEGCVIHGHIKNSIIFPGVFVGKDSHIEDSIIMSDTKIGTNTDIFNCIISENVKVGSGVKMGYGDNIKNRLKPNVYYSGITVVGEETSIPDNITIGKNVAIDVCINKEDYGSLNIESGEYVFKGGMVE